MRKSVIKLSPEENLAIAVRVAAGDSAARSLLIEGNLGLVKQRVSVFLNNRQRYRHLRDDLVSRGSIALVQVVNCIAKNKVEVASFEAYLDVALKRALEEQVTEDHTIRIPAEALRAAHEQGNPIKPLVRVELSDLPIESIAAEVEMRDTISACCHYDMERTFVRMREAGHKLKEIAQAVAMPVSTLHSMKSDLYARVLLKAGLQDTMKIK